MASQNKPSTYNQLETLLSSLSPFAVGFVMFCYARKVFAILTFSFTLRNKKCHHHSQLSQSRYLFPFPFPRDM